MATEIGKNLNYLEIASICALSEELYAELDNGVIAARIDVTFFGTRTVTLGKRTISLNALIQKVENLRDHSIWTRSAALHVITDIHNLYAMTDAQLDKKPWHRFITKFFIFIRETFIAPKLDHHDDRLKSRFKGYDSASACQQEFDLLLFPKDRFDILRRLDGTIARIYATEDIIHQKANDKKPLNTHIAEAISRQTQEASIQEICQDRHFAQDPVFYMVMRMIKKGVKTNYTPLDEKDNLVTAYIIRKIPEFVEVVTSPQYLRAFADIYFAYKPESDRKIFEKSLQTPEFQDSLNLISTNPQKWETIERNLRAVFTIFTQAEEGQTYKPPLVEALEEPQVVNGK